MSDFKALTTLPHFPELYCRGGLLLRGGAEGQGEEKGGEEEGRKGEGKGFAGLMSNCFVRACMIISIVSDNRKCRNCNDHQHGFCHCQTSRPNSVDSFAVHRPTCTAVCGCDAGGPSRLCFQPSSGQTARSWNDGTGMSAPIHCHPSNCVRDFADVCACSSCIRFLVDLVTSRHGNNKTMLVIYVTR